MILRASTYNKFLIQNDLDSDLSIICYDFKKTVYFLLIKSNTNETVVTTVSKLMCAETVKQNDLTQAVVSFTFSIKSDSLNKASEFLVNSNLIKNAATANSSGIC